MEVEEGGGQLSSIQQCDHDHEGGCRRGGLLQDDARIKESLLLILMVLSVFLLNAVFAS